MRFDDSSVRSSWNPWSLIPPESNLGEALTRGQVEAGRGGKVEIVWEIEFVSASPKSISGKMTRYASWLLVRPEIEVESRIDRVTLTVGYGNRDLQNSPKGFPQARSKVE